MQLEPRPPGAPALREVGTWNWDRGAWGPPSRGPGSASPAGERGRSSQRDATGSRQTSSVPPDGPPGLLPNNRGLASLGASDLGSWSRMQRLDRRTSEAADNLPPAEPPPAYVCPVTFPQGSHFRIAQGEQNFVSFYSDVPPYGVKLTQWGPPRGHIFLPHGRCANELWTKPTRRSFCSPVGRP